MGDRGEGGRREWEIEEVVKGKNTLSRGGVELQGKVVGLTSFSHQWRLKQHLQVKWNVEKLFIRENTSIQHYLHLHTQMTRVRYVPPSTIPHSSTLLFRTPPISYSHSSTLSLLIAPLITFSLHILFFSPACLYTHIPIPLLPHPPSYCTLHLSSPTPPPSPPSVLLTSTKAEWIWLT